MAFATKAENVAYISKYIVRTFKTNVNRGSAVEKVVAARSFGYVIIAKIFYCAYKKQIDKLLADR